MHRYGGHPSKAIGDDVVCLGVAPSSQGKYLHDVTAHDVDEAVFALDSDRAATAKRSSEGLPPFGVAL